MADQEQYSEPEEVTTTDTIQDAEIVPDKNMLTDEAVIDRSHATGGSSGPTVDEWRPPPFEEEEGEIKDDAKEKEKEQPKSEFANPDLEELPPEAKEEGAAFMADAALEVYGETKREIGNLFIPIKKRRLTRLEEDGWINLDMPIPSRDGKNYPAIDYISRYNNKAIDAFGLRDEFKNEVRPILIREFSKQGIGLGPWQRIGIAVAIDLKKDVKIAIALRGEADRIIEALKEATEMYRNYGQQGTGGPLGGQPSPGNGPAGQAAPGSSGPAAQPAEQAPDQQQAESSHVVDTTLLREEALASEFDKIQQQNRGDGGMVIPININGPSAGPGGNKTRSNRRPGSKRNRKKK